MGGAIRHLNNFIPALMEKNITDNYILILREDVEFDFQNNHLEMFRVPKIIGINFFLRTLFDLVYLPLYTVITKTELVISLLNFGPIFLSKPHINFQRNALFFCPEYINKLRGVEKIQSNLRSALLYLTMKYADLIVTPSNSMAEMITEKYPSLKNKYFNTIHHGFSIKTKVIANSHWENILREDERIKLLYPTHPAPHKGFEVLFEALYKLKRKNYKFVLYTTIEYKDWPFVVGKYEAQVKQLGIEENVIFTGRIQQDQMDQFYKYCDLMVYPSLCESFGFSMVEAIGYGLPIVASDTEVNKEICGEAAIYYSARNPEAAAQSILIGISAKVREDLKEKAKNRISSIDWSWARYVNEFLKIIENVK